MAVKEQRTAAMSVRRTAKRAKKQSASPAKRPRRASPSSAAVEAYLRDLTHPMKAELGALRRMILGVSAGVGEDIKWNAPSFHTADHFATFNLHGKDGLRLILHTGAKTKVTAKTGLDIPDPAGLIQWQAKDRGMVTFRDAKDVGDKAAALKAILRAWVAVMRSL